MRKENWLYDERQSFTHGHRHLIQQAAAAVRLAASVPVKEATSRFPMKTDSIQPQRGLPISPRLTVHRGSGIHYFSCDVPRWLNKRAERWLIALLYRKSTLKIFRQYRRPRFWQHHTPLCRYGLLVFCTVTFQYNLPADMRFWLETPTLPAPPITLVK